MSTEEMEQPKNHGWIGDWEISESDGQLYVGGELVTRNWWGNNRIIRDNNGRAIRVEGEIGEIERDWNSDDLRIKRVGGRRLSDGSYLDLDRLS